MPKIFNTVRKVKRVVGGAVDAVVNFPARMRAGFRMGARLVVVIGHRLVAGFRLGLSPFSVLSTVGFGFAVRQTRIDVEHQGWVQSSSQSAGGDWDNINNHNGPSDGARAELDEGFLLVQGTLTGSFAAQINRQPLEITQVILRCYYQLSEFLLAGSTLVVQYRNGALGLPVNLATHSGGIISVTNVDRLSGFDFDITALGPDGQGAAWTWQALSDLLVDYQGTILVNAGLSNVLVEASRLQISATHTEDL